MAEWLSTARSRVQTLLDQFPYVPRSLALLWKATGLWTLAWSLLLVLQGVLPVAIVFLTQWVVDGLVESVAVGGSWESVRPTLILVALMAVVMLANELLNSATGWIRAVQSELLGDHVNALIHEKSLGADLAFYESPEFYDHLHRARAEAKYRPLALLENAGSLGRSGITLVAMAAVLLPLGPWLPVILLLSTLPALFVVLHYSLREHQWRLDRTPDERRTWYYDWLLTSGDTAAELRLFGLGRHFQLAFQSTRGRLRAERLKLARNEGMAEASAGTLGLLISGVALGWMAWKTMQGLVSLGQLALFYQAFYRGQSLMRSLLQNVGRAYANVLFLSNLFEFLDLQPQVLDPTNPSKMVERLKEGVNFRHVTFRYPGSERLALHDFSLFIPAGKTVAIVGANGASKSTLLKLICRFYDPEDGQIELDGIDLRAFSLQDLRENTTVLLQEPVHYSETVRENIRLGNLAAVVNPAEIRTAAAAANLGEVVDSLPEGYETLLGKWFEDGTELSVGEWKRICLARSFFRKASIILLDEPTSGMDAWAEAEWMEHFVEGGRGKTAVIITHRFTTAMRADIIHVMQRGHIIESGDHEQLLAQNGEYARSWRKQVPECPA